MHNKTVATLRFVPIENFRITAKRGWRMGVAHNEICPYGQVKSLRGENFSANVKCSLCERGQISFHIERSEIFHSVRENVISRFTKVKHFTLLKAT